MKVFVTGVNGQLGHDVMTELENRKHMGIGSDIAAICNWESGQDYRSLDITDAKTVGAVLHDISPDAVVHCAAWTAVDEAEDNDKRQTVFAVNESGTRNIASVCRELNCKMLYISTDYVFNGQGAAPWEPDCPEVMPLNVYGQSKRAGELAVTALLTRFFIVRTSWIFGKNGSNFVRTMLSLGKKYPEIRVVNDQVGTPTYTHDLARLLVDMIETGKYGFYHATNEGGYISWYDFACEIFKQAGYTVKLVPVTTAEYGRNKAHRPVNGRLSKEKLTTYGFLHLPPWQDALARYLKEIEF